MEAGAGALLRGPAGLFHASPSAPLSLLSADVPVS